jgi:hypothetical protein
LQMFAPHAAEPTARGIASNAGKSTVSSGLAVVGRVSGTGDCDWADDSTDADMDQDVCVGRKYALASGLLEISYASGARVLLEGPCVYTAESPTSGFLAVGKLTAKLEPPEGLLAAGAAARQQRAGGKNIFSVRTPAAVVTDLGTEFGVEVEKDGRTSAHVFCGAVAVLPATASRPSESVVLRQGDSARIGAGRNAVERVSVDPDRFVTRIAKRRVPLEVFGTGVGVRPGDPDPHWDVAAVGGDSSFVARPATVLMSTRSTWAQPEPGREKWISATSEWYWTVAAETPCTFRTTFEIREGIPDTALLRGRVYAPGGIKALRLNGRETAGFVAEEGPKYPWESGNAPQKLLIDRGFVAGRNVLEFDVISTDPPMAGQPLSALGLRVELKGWVQERP